MSLQNFLRQSRIVFQLPSGKIALREVKVSDLEQSNANGKLAKYIADRAPLFYRDFKNVVNSLKDGFLLTTLKETLEKLPKSDHFKSSHFGEIATCIFLEEIVGLKKIYSKLSLNTTENQNAYKMDLLCYLPGTAPLNFIFCEVKSSPKNAKEGLPPGHDKSCYADIFTSLKEYEEADKKFDITCIKDNLSNIDEPDRTLIREAVKPYSKQIIGYIGIGVIDSSTYDDNEVPILATRKSKVNFNVELICVENYRATALETYKILENIQQIL